VFTAAPPVLSVTLAVLDQMRGEPPHPPVLVGAPWRGRAVGAVFVVEVLITDM
jgi:hypothetical protein